MIGSEEAATENKVNTAYARSGQKTSGSSKRSPFDIRIAIQRPRLTVKKTADTAIESWSAPTNKHRETMPALSSLELVVSTVVAVPAVVDI
tara:strand:+ start:227 stop:499 length:273 start_codon:yes stop_codon:yes gene_type:complete